ncbi:hypothetical protein B0G76_1298 [Paraburkholderia sp. BL23I1N1]|uniref:hypothetical protein n=1 Tax=Paraburkholderia sp. BL23I1N1 TaxID=1938802 RepID=UPI000E750135|nr:hypothetical protein [Paraburkholderia sp. BL23I1N1]RKE35237.1 hypothetical protein B0G76_1298 [Paraburkholderia sp. BL23I1N1]
MNRAVTHTLATLELTECTYREIERKLRAAGYGHLFVQCADGSAAIDMTGIAIAIAPHPARPYCTCGGGGHPSYCEVHAA